MLSKIRKRFTWANVAMTLALVFAMTGGAYAAKKYLITSTKQISPKVLKQLQGKAGPTGPQGPAGPAGAAGKEGTPGKEGAPGKEGKEGKQGIQGIQGIPGNEGSPWTAGGTLPSGKTEKGTWAVSAQAFGAALTPVSFPIPLAHPLGKENVFLVENGTTIAGACEGTVAEPEAAKGDLCVYVRTANIPPDEESYGKGSKAIRVATGETLFTTPVGAEVSGAVLFFLGEGAAWGSWAVTAE